ncbi:MAG TPA: serine hydrolase domain-containing protein [Vicinamibacterales bacterium]|jgi:CubicO group peptidase (beta-lactamase class C family)
MPSHHRLVCGGLVASLILLHGPVGFTQTTAPGTGVVAQYVDARARARQIANAVLARGIPGLAVAVAVDGRVVYAEGFGDADLEQRVPAWPSTKFRIGSISKPLTAVALMQLVEQRRIDLDAAVQKYVLSFPDKGATITPRLLAGHLAGIRHYKDDEFLSAAHYDSVVDGLKIFANDPLVAPPGTKYSYSTYGFTLLSAAIEAASGEPFLDYMQRHVFDALGLAHTTADQNRLLIDERSRFYARPKDGSLENAPYVDNSYKWAGGGFLSTAEDMVRFGSALLHPGFLTADSLKLLFTSQKTTDGKETGYGMGWSIHKSHTGQRVYEHSGGSVGGSCQLIVYPDSGVVVALLTNLGDALWKITDVEAIGERFAR